MSEFSCNDSVFCSSDWLGIVCPSGFQALRFTKGNVVGAEWLIYPQRSRFGRTYVLQPPLTPVCRPRFFFVDSKPATMLDRKKEALDFFLDQLNGFSGVDLCLGESDYLFPFVAHQYELRLGLTYRLDLSSGFERIWENSFNSQLRSQYKKAKGLADFEFTKDWRRIFDLVEKTFHRQGVACPYSYEMVSQIGQLIDGRGTGFGLLAVGQQDKKDYAGGLFVIDSGRCYNLLSGADPVLRKSDATTLILVEAIKAASGKKCLEFDFEGSTLPGVERFYRAFGGSQVQLPQIRRWDRIKKFSHLFQ